MSRQSHFGSSNPSAWSEQTFFAEQRTTKLTPAFYGHFYPETRKIRSRGSPIDRSMTGFSLILQHFRRFCPCGHKRTLTCLVDKLAFFYGGDGGNRTPVRKCFSRNFSGRSRLFAFPRLSASRHAMRLGSFIIHGAVKAFRTHVHHLSTPHPGPWSSRVERSLIMQREDRF